MKVTTRVLKAELAKSKQAQEKTIFLDTPGVFTSGTEYFLKGLGESKRGRFK